MDLTYTILIATLGQREERFMKLMKVLLPQLEQFNGKARVLAYWNNFELPLSVIRQSLVEESTSDYINFIDDDDMVPGYYVDKVMHNLGKDYVGWRMQAFMDKKPLKPTYHSVRYPQWAEDENGYYRNISHLNPIRREIALKASFITDEGKPEDYDWAQKVAPLVKTENYIRSIMYYYYASAEDSKWRGGNEKEKFIRPSIDSRYFSWHPDSKEEYGNS